MWTVRVVDQYGLTTFIKRGMIKPLALSWAKTLGGKIIVLDTIREYRVLKG